MYVSDIFLLTWQINMFRYFVAKISNNFESWKKKIYAYISLKFMSFYGVTPAMSFHKYCGVTPVSGNSKIISFRGSETTCVMLLNHHSLNMSFFFDLDDFVWWLVTTSFRNQKSVFFLSFFRWFKTTEILLALQPPNMQFELVVDQYNTNFWVVRDHQLFVV